MNFQLNLRSEAVEQLHPSKPLCVPPDITVREALRQMKEGNQAAVLICRNGSLAGIFTERDALKMMAQGADFDVLIADVMTRSPVSLAGHGSVGAAITRMAQGGYRRLPVVGEQGRPLGLVNVEGILHYLVEHFPAVVYNLPPEPHHAIHAREGA